MTKGTKEQIKQQRIRKKNRISEYILNYKKDKCCVFCGFNEHTEILNFHHTGEKEFAMAQARQRNASKERMEKEFKKCILLCPNCHMWHHYNQNGKRK